MGRPRRNMTDANGNVVTSEPTGKIVSINFGLDGTPERALYDRLRAASDGRPMARYLLALLGGAVDAGVEHDRELFRTAK